MPPKRPKKMWSSQDTIGIQLPPLPTPLTRAEEKAFWDLVSDIGWGKPSRHKGKPSKVVQAAQEIPADVRRVLYDIASNKADELRSRYYAWVEQMGGEPGDMIPLGDDSFDDLVSHVVGCGREVYDAAMRDPRFLVGMQDQAVENFRYLFLD